MAMEASEAWDMAMEDSVALAVAMAVVLEVMALELEDMDIVLAMDVAASAPHGMEDMESLGSIEKKKRKKNPEDFQL